MGKITKEDKKIIEDNLKKIKLDLDNIPNIFKIEEKIKFRTEKEYDNSSYKSYKFIKIKDIEIYITMATRSDSPEKKYKLSKPLMQYLLHNDEDDMELYYDFLGKVKQLDLNRIEELEQNQKEYRKQIPYKIKYKDDFIWDIYYSEIDNKYFMMFPIKEMQSETLFYIIKKQIQLQNSKNKEEKIYVPINNKQLDYEYLKKSEIADLENYLWYFTKEWPSIYELEDIEGNKTIQILGRTEVYEKVKSIYKMVLNNKEEAEKQFKLIKALFILQSNMEKEYDFKVLLNEKGSISFYYNHNEITYEVLPTFIKNEIDNKKEKIDVITKQNILALERWQLTNSIVQKQNEEYLLKEKQIVTFLECKKSFFGKVSYFFKTKKKKKNKEKDKTNEEEKTTTKEDQKIEQVEELEQKENYTIEDLLKVGNVLEEKEKEYKNKIMDIAALENKKENLESMIKNATLYINEIESHKKSIFDFWKFTNKDNATLLKEGTIQKEENNSNKIKKVFSYENDMENFAISVDNIQRRIFNQKECDAIFSIYKDVTSFNILSKDKISKKDEKEIEQILKEKCENYEKNYEQIKQKDFDIFGSVIEDKTKIKILKNNKHREIEKEEYKVLNIHLNTTLEEYEDIIKHYEIILNESYNKMTSPCDISIYKIANTNIENQNWEIMNINAKDEIYKSDAKEEQLILSRINVEEKMPIVFYSNIMFYDNFNQTLPEGMDISKQALINLEKYNLELVSRRDFKINFLENEFKNIVKNIQVYEYNITERKQK